MNSFTPTNILITGGAGFIGINYLLHSLKIFPQSKHINIDKITYAANSLALQKLASNPHYVFVQGDIGDVVLIKDLLRKYQINTIINFAAESHVDRSIKDPLLFVKSNVLGTANLLDSAKKYWLDELNLAENECLFYHISTDEVFGSLTPFDPRSIETHPYRPRSPYAASKASADHFVQAYYHTYGLPAVISHCSNNYGPYQHKEKFIPTIINACLKWQSIPIYGDGENIRDWIYVEDHCRAIEAILIQGKIGEAYNIGANKQLSNNLLVKEICDLMDELYSPDKSYNSLITYVKDRPGHDWRYALDTQKIHRELNWQAKISIKEGLLKTIKYYKICDPIIYQTKVLE